MKKGFINIALTILVVVLATVAVYFALTKESILNQKRNKVGTEIGGSSLVLKESYGSPLPLPDKNIWKLYRNESCGFEIKYPPEYSQWKPNGDCTNLDDQERNEDLSIVSKSECKFPFRDIPGCQLHSVFIANSKVRIEGIEGIGVTKENITFGGLPGEKITVLGGVEPTLGEITIQAQRSVGIWYRYYFAFHVKDKESAEKTLTEILSTFKIFKELPSTYNLFDGGSFTFETPNYWLSKTTREGVRKTTEFTDKGSLVFYISTMPNQGGVTLDEWWQEESKTSRYQKVGERSIDGVQAYELILPETGAGPLYVLITGTTRSIGTIYNIQATQIEHNTLNRILFTFDIK